MFTCVAHCYRRDLVQMVPGQEQVDQGVLGGLCAGDGDPGGKSG